MRKQILFLLVTLLLTVLVLWLNAYRINTGNANVLLTLVSLALGLVWMVMMLVSGVTMIGYFALVVYPVLSRLALRTIGLQAEGTVVASERKDDDGDVFFEGRYQFVDQHGETHKVTFHSPTVHWPDEAQWARMEQGYAKGAKHRVYYFALLPSICVMDFPESQHLK